MSRVADGATPVLEPHAAAPRTMRGHHVGRIVGTSTGCWLVDFGDNPHGPLPARTTLGPDAAALEQASAAGAEALLVFEHERSDRPIVVGLLSPPVPAPPVGPPRAEAIVDGERLVYAARQEIVLRCGRASIQLTSDGSVRIRGTNVLSRAAATNRIRGGNVQIN
jgi:hypothetical protein